MKTYRKPLIIGGFVLGLGSLSYVYFDETLGAFGLLIIVTGAFFVAIGLLRMRSEVFGNKRSLNHFQPEFKTQIRKLNNEGKLKSKQKMRKHRVPIKKAEAHSKNKLSKV